MCVRVHHIHLDLDLGVINKGNGTYDVWRRRATANTERTARARAPSKRERINEPEACKYMRIKYTWAQLCVCVFVCTRVVGWYTAHIRLPLTHIYTHICDNGERYILLLFSGLTNSHLFRMAAAMCQSAIIESRVQFTNLCTCNYGPDRV